MKTEKNRPPFLIIGLFAGLTAALAWVGVSLIRWKEFGDFFPFSAIGAILLFIGFACAAIRATGVRGRLFVLRAAGASGLFCFLMPGLLMIVNNLLNNGMGIGPRLAVFVSIPLSVIYSALLLARAVAPKRGLRPIKITAGALAFAVLVTSGVIQYNYMYAPLLPPEFSAPDLIQGEERVPGTNEFILSEERTFNTALISEGGNPERHLFWITPFSIERGAASYSLEAFVDGEWRMIHRGERIQTRAG